MVRLLQMHPAQNAQGFACSLFCLERQEWSKGRKINRVKCITQSGQGILLMTASIDFVSSLGLPIGIAAAKRGRKKFFKLNFSSKTWRCQVLVGK